MSSAAQTPDPHDPEAGTVVDPAVLAERRARRAEMAEETLLDRAKAAERVAVELEARVAVLERGLDEAARERDQLRAELSEREAALVAARQSEEAERRRRDEVEVAADAGRRALQGDLEDLRARVGAAEQWAAELAVELERARLDAERHREQAEAERAARRRLEQSAQEVADLSRSLQDRRAEIADELGGLRVRTEGLEQDLAAQVGARAHAEAALAAERERAEAEITLLQHELDRRSQIQDAVQRGLTDLGAEVGRVREAAEHDTERRLAAEAVLADVGATTRRLRDELTALQAEREEERAHLRQAQAALAEREADLEEAHAVLTIARAEIAEARTLAEQQTVALAESEAALAAARATADELRAALADEQERREELADRLAGAEEELRTRLTAERRVFDDRLGAAERTVADLRGRLAAAVGEHESERKRADRAQGRVLEVTMERDSLSGALAEREELDAQVRETLQTLRVQLEEVRVESDARAAREQAVEGLIAELVGTAASLREGFDRELAVVRRQMEERAAVATGEMARELEERRSVEEAARRALIAAEQELAQLRRAQDGPDPAPVLADLAAAARRLRATPEDANVEPDGEAAPAPPVAGPPPAPAPAAVAAPWPAEAPVVPVRPRVVPDHLRPPTDWLAPALGVVAEHDHELALRALLALLPAQGPAVRRELTYDLTVRGIGTWRVALDPVGGRVTPHGATDSPVEVSVAGDLRSLAPLAAGGAGRRMPGVEILGARRRLRPLRKARRAPVGLPDLHRAGVALAPGVLLALLAAGVDPAWIGDHPQVVDYTVAGAAGGTWRVTLLPGRRPEVRTVLAADGPPDATVQVGAAALLPLLAAMALPPGERMLVVGDERAARRVTVLLGRAQGLPADVA